MPDEPRHDPPEGVALPIPDALIEAVALRVIEVLDGRFAEPEPFMNSTEAATYLACGVSRIYALVSAKRIPHHYDGSRLLFRPSELDDFVAEGGARRP